jgi:CHAT domain-containing protein/Tfp pilus assembly protein PilF
MEREAQRLTDATVALYRGGRYAEAVVQAEQALALYRWLYPDGHPHLGRGLNNLGALLQAQGQYGKALPLYEEALALQRRLYPREKYPAGHTALANSLNSLGTLLQAMGRYAEARPYLEEALTQHRRLFLREKYPTGHPTLARSVSNLGTLLLNQGRYAQALPLYEETLAMFRQAYPKARYPDGHADLAQSLNNLGYLLYVQDRYAQARPYLEEALAMRRRLYPNGHPLLAQSLITLGGLLHAQRQHVKALPYVEEALALRRRLYPADRYPDGHPELARSLNNLGYLIHAQGRTAQALPYLQEALTLRRRLYPVAKYPDGHPELAQILNNVGVLLYSQGQTAQGWAHCEEALALRRRLYPADRYPDGHPELVESLLSQGVLLQAEGRYAQARPLYEEALALNRRLYPAQTYPDGHFKLAVALHDLSTLALDQGEYARALPFCEEALAIYQRLADRVAQSSAESDALTFLDGLPLSRDTFLAVTQHLAGGAGPAYARLWSGRAAVTRALAQRHLAVRAARQPEVRDTWADLLDSRRQLARLLLQPGPRDPARDGAVRELTERKERLERDLARSLPALAEQQQLEALGPADLQAVLPPRTAFLDLLRYTAVEREPKVLGKQGERHTPRYVAFVVRPGQPVRRAELGEAAPIERALADWQQAIAGRRDSPAAPRLRDLVWEPVARHLGPDTEAVYLAPEGALARLPWAALPGKQPGTVLLEEHAIAVVPHGQFLLAALRRQDRAADPAGALLAVGGVRYDEAPAPTAGRREPLLAQRGPDRDGVAGRWDYLPGSARELRLLRAAAAGRPVTVLDGSSASTARLLQELPRARLAHLATHGFFNETEFRTEQRRAEAQLQAWQFQIDRPTQLAGGGAQSPLAYTGLVLAGANVPDKAGPDGGILTGEVLMELPLEGLRLAVLSACQTGLGEVPGNECVRNLQNAFHLAGCPNVVASLWNVPDEPTAALMAVFYAELLARKRPPLEALRQAQLAVYRNPGQIRELAERGSERPRPEGASEGVASPRAAVKDWAGFVLSGAGR